ncbi:hypothetical protein [Magnetospirillum aberrantis]|uniref:Radical SAM protein n=1 Tax=Magnetospirillum aberrantis SpK TaxID=908842 RepID=A0A7C9QUX4_9PROT|nr:hypothetical protein [Magnetospirillum aberrantis]NFV81184.1 hypothetical protein [Magnetospirillum aberrantis SpK]
MALPMLDIPQHLNYVGAFLTLECNLDCSYCINDPDQAGKRRSSFAGQGATLSPEQWVLALGRIPARDDLPITLQGGEPTLFGKGKGLGILLGGVPNRFDLLTNMALKPAAFAAAVAGCQDKLRRDAPYPSIRVSWHPAEMHRVWGTRAFAELVERCVGLGEYGFRVHPDKRLSDVGIYMVDVPGNHLHDEMLALAAGKVPVETKEFLGMHEGRLYGTYLYPFSTNLLAGGYHDRTLECECRTSELLIDPQGFVWQCHAFLYQSMIDGGLQDALARLGECGFELTRHADEVLAGVPFRPVGHMLDPDFTLDEIRKFRACTHYGRCIGCDTKVKNNRFQSLDDEQTPHTSVEIRNLRMPGEVRNLLPAAERNRWYFDQRQAS